MKSGHVMHRLITVVSFLAGLVVWELVGRLGVSPLFPPFSGVIRAWLDLMHKPEMYTGLASSLQTLLVGYGLAVVIGVIIGLLMGYFPNVDQSIGVIVNALQGAPAIAFVPVLMILFGTGPQVQISVVFFFAFFVIAVGAETGAKETDPRLIEMAKSFQASDFTVFTRIILPSSLRYLVSALHMGILRAIQGLVTAEMLVTLKGIGADIMYYGQSFIMDYLFATIINILLLAVILGGLIKLVCGYRLQK